MKRVFTLNLMAHHWMYHFYMVYTSPIMRACFSPIQTYFVTEIHVYTLFTKRIRKYCIFHINEKMQSNNVNIICPSPIGTVKIPTRGDGERHNALQVRDLTLYETQITLIWQQNFPLQFTEPQKTRLPSRRNAHPKTVIPTRHGCSQTHHTYMESLFKQTKNKKTQLLTKWHRQKRKKIMCRVHSAMWLLLMIHPAEHVACHLLCSRWVNPGAREAQKPRHSHFSLSLLSLEFSFIVHIFTSLCSSNAVISDATIYESNSEKSQSENFHKPGSHDIPLY